MFGFYPKRKNRFVFFQRLDFLSSEKGAIIIILCLPLGSIVKIIKALRARTMSYVDYTSRTVEENTYYIVCKYLY